MAKKKAPQEGGKRVDDSNVLGLHAEVLEQPITQTLELNYMPYAMSVIVSRAIPEIDGFKPSHRKLLYTMYQMKLLGGNRTKSANVVGATMKLNPHGDAAIYDTMVRLSRGYGALLHPLVDSKGNFGKVYSRDMAWAAPRYTEVRLDPICAEFFRDIDQDAVDFVPNYDGTMEEPTLLPTTFPNVLVSSNMGIAVGMASNICGFNLSEVCDTTAAYLKNPNCDLMATLKAPDFPTGGELLYDEKELSAIYETGRGSFKVQARWRYVKEENLIEIYEIPYSTTVEAIMDKVSELVKSGKVKEISDMRDETDLSGLKLTMDLKRSTDPDKLMARLFRMTPLRDSFSCNFNILIAGMPRVMGVRQILEEWTAWRMESIRRRTYFVLGKRREKLHLLQGLQKILLDIDKAIKIIRETEEDAEVVPNLMIGFGIDEVQAEYVADIKLRNINKEYILKRTRETEDLEKEIADLQDLVDSPSRIKKTIVSELAAVKKKYAIPRKTGLLYDRPEEADDGGEDVPDYPVNVFLSREGYFKKITPQSLRMSSEQKYKEGDGAYLQWECTNRDELLVFTDRQQCYKTRMSDFEDAKASVLGDYLPTKLGFDEGESFLWACVPGDYSGNLLFFFENGKVARVELAGYQTQTRRKRLTGAYSDKSPLVRGFLLREDMEMAVWSTEGRCLIFHTALLAPKTTRTTQGVGVLTLKPKYKVEGAAPLDQTPIQNAARYRARSLPVAGALLKEEDRGEEQMSLL
ncbi:DNA topoisomerase (ATP-hydrolyzing) subunit A [uncultured Intestinimonas sp.]|uniref:DNA gyrase/topoisomerase IV subunit A n=1 Tax=uncultured Intestinimonas sp. TaxID=1689265 RepID=UPI0026000FEE|nr:DNA topoisomerase (ATP-hydrolyzing) subunit A [uncultured Intestinimonas sp.]